MCSRQQQLPERLSADLSNPATIRQYADALHGGYLAEIVKKLVKRVDWQREGYDPCWAPHIPLTDLIKELGGFVPSPTVFQLLHSHYESARKGPFVCRQRGVAQALVYPAAASGADVEASDYFSAFPFGPAQELSVIRRGHQLLQEHPQQMAHGRLNGGIRALSVHGLRVSVSMVARNYTSSHRLFFASAGESVRHATRRVRCRRRFRVVILVIARGGRAGAQRTQSTGARARIRQCSANE